MTNEGDAEEIDWTATEPPTESRPGFIRRHVAFLSFVVAVIVLVIAAAIVVYNFEFRSFVIPSAANTPTIRAGDHVLMMKGSSVHRGEFIIFSSPADRSLLVVMRVVGVAGDQLSDHGGKVYIDGRLDPETYLSKGTVTGPFRDVTVPAGTVFVMGDNRSDSADSRTYGPVPTSSIKGHLVFRYWPLSRIGGI